MINRILLVVGALFFLASCETATQNALKGSAGKAVLQNRSASIFGSAKQTQADKLIAVGDRVLFDYDSSELSSEAKLTLTSNQDF